MDLEARTQDPRAPGMESWIARERLHPEKAPLWWWLSLASIALVATLLLAALASEPTERVAAEETYRNTDGFVQALQAFVEPSAARLWSAVSTGVLVIAVGVFARRLLHAELPALLAAGLVAIDPAVLVHGRLATPVAPGTASAVLALALFSLPGGSAHWWGAGAFAYAAFMDPSHLLWGPPLFFYVLVRGHIYAAPQHAITAGMQTLLVPAVGMVLGILGASSLDEGCYLPGRAAGLFLLQTPDLGGLWALPNIVTYFAGMGALGYLGAWSAVTLLRDFRLQRLPGRMQVRLSQPMRRVQSRAAWLLFFAVFAPTPLLWVPIFAVALAAGVQELSRDARAFGFVVGAVIAVFAAVAASQSLDVLLARPDAAMHIPWTRLAGC